MQKIVTLINQNHLINLTSLTRKNFFLFDIRFDSNLKTQKRQNFIAKSSRCLENQKFYHLKNQLNALDQKIDIRQEVFEGQNIPSYHNIYNVFTQQTKELTHQQGQILLIKIWATWSKSAQVSMQNVHQIFEKNEKKWKDKVRLVGVSVDEKIDLIRSRVNQKAWNKFQHLTLKGWNIDFPLIKDFNIQGIPSVILVDKDGKVDYIGRPDTINLQQKIDILLKKDLSRNSFEQQQQNEISVQKLIEEIKEIQRLQTLLSEQTLLTKFKQVKLFAIKCEGQLKISKGKITKRQLKIKVSTFEDTPEVIEQFKQILKDLDPTIYTLEQHLVKFQEPPSLVNAYCTQCKVKLEYPCYWCRWEQDSKTFRCRQCVQKKSGEEEKKYSYNKNCILLTRKCERIAQSSFGANIQPSSLQKVKQSHQFSCNGCQYIPKEIGQPRYICLACGSDPKHRLDYVDICEQCSVLYLDGDQKVEKALKNDGHRDNHPLLRILYNVDGYYKF